MQTKKIALIGVIAILVVTAAIVFTHAKISGNAILSGATAPEKIKPYPKPKPYPPYEPGILPIPKPNCKEGGRRCVGENLQGCIGSEWIVMATCRPGTTCTTSGCKAIQPSCNTGGRRCVGNNLQGCISGEWIVMATCPTGNRCTIDGCKSVQPTCQSGRTQCINNNYQACINGQWIVTATCGYDQYCYRGSGCVTIPLAPSNIILVQNALPCPARPVPQIITLPAPVAKQNDCDLKGKTADIEFYLKSLENTVESCSQIQTQQASIAQSDKQYIFYQISLLYPGYPYFPSYQPNVCTLIPETSQIPPAPAFTPTKGPTYFTDWLKYLTQTTQDYCTTAQQIITPLVNGCNNINANLAACGTDFNAQNAYTNYLDTQQQASNSKIIYATTLSQTFSLNIKQFRDASAQGITC
jgi:hypothetical protein